MRVHKLLGEAIDTLCFVFILAGTLFFFSYYWSDMYRLEYAEYVTEKFFDEAERVQRISAEDYVALFQKVKSLNDRFELSLQIKRGGLVIYQSELREYLLEKQQFPLREGDFIMVTINRGTRKRAVLSTVIWW